MVVLYRKYRPQKLAEIDSPAVREKLEKILVSGKLPHALLFTGPKGTGKTSSARIFAKSINCEKSKVGEPCNKCSTCVSITNGSNLDILEIDAASNRGIDDVRELRDKIKFSPSFAKYKVYIIDEVHMLTNEAFNALLKTLEEPPVHAIFILCTTNAEKLPETIVDRCVKIDFKRATQVEIMESLKRVKKGEGREVDKEALLEIAAQSDGSYRDSHKLLEEILMNYAEDPITVKQVREVLIDKEKPDDLFDWILTADAGQGLTMVGKLVSKGADFKFIIETILNGLHQTLLRKYGVENKDVIFPQQFNNLTIEQLKLLINLLSQAFSEMKTSVLPQLPLELAIVEWCENQSENGQVTERSLLAPEAKPKGFSRERPYETHAQSEAVARRFPENDAEALQQKWEDLLIRVKPYNHSVAGLLHSCKPIGFENDELMIEVFYKFHYDKLSEVKTREVLDKAAKEVWGKEIKVKPVFKEKKK